GRRVSARAAPERLGLVGDVRVVGTLGNVEVQILARFIGQLDQVFQGNGVHCVRSLTVLELGVRRQRTVGLRGLRGAVSAQQVHGSDGGEIGEECFEVGGPDNAGARGGGGAGGGRG